MAIAKKCDRCGTYYDEITKCEVSGEYITGVATIVGGYVSDLHRRYDLCDDCRRSFYNWLAMNEVSTKRKKEPYPYLI